MDVYLVPVAADRYELYCEVPDDPEEGPVEERNPGRFKRLVRWFRQMIAEAERERRQGSPVSSQGGWVSRFKARAMRWVAETIAEQKLLWHLRQQDIVCLHYPDDIDEHAAVSTLRQQLGQDAEKHRRWMYIDGTLCVLSVVVLGPLFLLVPGVANLPAAFFGFRLVGHYLSHQGAARGLNVVSWRPEASAPLTELRSLLALDCGTREPRVHAVAKMLRLEHFESFFQRTAVSA